MSYPISKENFVKMWFEFGDNKGEPNMQFLDALYTCLEKAYDDGFEAGMKKAGVKRE